MRFPWGGLCLAFLCLLAGPARADDESTAVTLGGETVLHLRPAAGQSAARRVDAVNDRLNVILGVPDIQPGDVAVLVQPPRDPVIFVFGRRFLTVNAATATDGLPGDSLTLALRVARRLQQILPRVNYRPSNAPEPVVPPHPPLTVTGNIALVGGDTGPVLWRGRTAFTLLGLPPPDAAGVRRTAAERADALTARLSEIAAHVSGSLQPGDVSVNDLPNGDAQIVVGAYTLLAVSPADALFNAADSPHALAERWAHEFRASLLAAAKPPKSPGR